MKSPDSEGNPLLIIALANGAEMVTTYLVSMGRSPTCV